MNQGTKIINCLGWGGWVARFPFICQWFWGWVGGFLAHVSGIKEQTRGRKFFPYPINSMR